MSGTDAGGPRGAAGSDKVRVAIDPQGQIVSVTTSAAQLFGWAVAELAGQRVEVLFRRS